jgi:hypothetical protein
MEQKSDGERRIVVTNICWLAHEKASFTFTGKINKIFQNENQRKNRRRTGMKQIAIICISVLIIFFFTGVTRAQDPIVFPAKGQSQEQMEKDKFECYTWAKQQTGFDPMQVPTASAPPPQQKAGQGGTLKGAAVGAGAGALIKRKGSRSKGAATGALVGGVLGGARQSQKNSQDQQARQQWERQQANEYAQKRNTYNRAYGACLEGKGYTVK